MQTRVAQGPIIQVAWVIEDIDAAESLWGSAFGIAKWTRIPDVHFGPDTCTYRGEPADFVVHVSLAYAGDLQLELIQPVSGDNIYTEFLGAGGPGLHHVCFESDDLDTAVATTRYRVGEVNFERQAFASFPDQVIVLRLTASRPGQLTWCLHPTPGCLKAHLAPAPDRPARPGCDAACQLDAWPDRWVDTELAIARG